MIRNYLDLHSAMNVLYNGNFQILPFEWEPISSKYKIKTSSGSAFEGEELKWQKKRIKKGALIKTTPSRSILPGWEIWADVNDGASLEFNPYKSNGLRVYSYEGGHVAVIRFKQACNVYVKQVLDYFNEFPLQPATLSASLYTMKGSAGFNIDLDFGTSTEGVISAYGGNFGNYFRTTDVITCPGDMNKLDVIVRINGISEEAIGFSGINLCLGSYNPSCPYTDNPVQRVHASASMILWEGDEVPCGYEAEEANTYYVHTLGDPMSVDFTPPPSIPILSWPIQSVIGTDFHNAHYSSNPYLDAPEGWHSNDALHSLRVRNGDIADRGSYTGTYGLSTGGAPPATIVRRASLLQMLKDSIRFGSWGFLGLNEDTWYAPGSVQDLIWSEFMKSVRCAILLPASPGRSWSSGSGGSMSFMDNWNQRHIHYLVPGSEIIDPPYRSFKVCMKV